MKLEELRQILKTEIIKLNFNNGSFESFLPTKHSNNNEYLEIAKEISMWNRYGDKEIDKIFCDNEILNINIK